MHVVRTIAGLCLLPVCLVSVARAQSLAAQVPATAVSSSVTDSSLPADDALDDAVAAELAMAVAREGYDPEQFQLPDRNVLTFSLISSSIHNSVLGWTQMTTPVVAYRFNRHWSVDLSVPAFFSLHSYVASSTTTYKLETLRHLVGDTAIATRYTTDFGRAFTYTGSATMSLPTGADSYGLGNGQVTYNFNHRVDYSTHWAAAPFIETGIGDTSSLIDREIQRTYTTIGHIAHFQAGSQFLLPLRSAFTVSAYENLPIGDQKIYRPVRVNHAWVERAVGVSLAEDNGIDTIVEVPVNRNVIVSGFYSRSLRLKYDTTGVSVTFSLRNPFKRGSY
ncbi:hypothetical protein [Terriglobus albidus]|uniref:hypothetical protein n=1 Tax=Terriglobus albidus TaxID=1592106 RepID=UPI0021E057C2|nr:hypothetical protein [Terriglobus albidus]